MSNINILDRNSVGTGGLVFQAMGQLSFITMVRIVNANNSEKIAKKLMKIGEIYSVDNYVDIEHEDRKLFLHALEVLDQKGIKTITPDQSANIIAIPVRNPGEETHETIYIRRDYSSISCDAP